MIKVYRKSIIHRTVKMGVFHTVHKLKCQGHSPKHWAINVYH